jgi:hypothetical protein
MGPLNGPLAVPFALTTIFALLPLVFNVPRDDGNAVLEQGVLRPFTRIISVNGRYGIENATSRTRRSTAIRAMSPDLRSQRYRAAAGQPVRAVHRRVAGRHDADHPRQLRAWGRVLVGQAQPNALSLRRARLPEQREQVGQPPLDIAAIEDQDRGEREDRQLHGPIDRRPSTT